MYVTLSNDPVAIKKELNGLGFSGKMITFLDGYSALNGNVSTTHTDSFDPTNWQLSIVTIKDALKTQSSNILIIDSLNILLDINEQKITIIQDIINILGKNTTIILSFTDWGYKAEIINILNHHLDLIIEIRSLEEKLFFRKYFEVKKANWIESTTFSTPFRVESGGVRVYIPKILVTGPLGSGKSSFIHSVSTRAVSVDRLGTTIALDHGHVDYHGFSCDLFGTPGQERFDPILSFLGKEALGVIVIISATDPASFGRVNDMIKKTETAGLPLVIVANKANLRGAIGDFAIRNIMDLDVNIPIVRTTAADITKVQPGQPCQLAPNDVEKVLDTLFKKLFWTK